MISVGGTGDSGLEATEFSAVLSDFEGGAMPSVEVLPDEMNRVDFLRDIG